VKHDHQAIVATCFEAGRVTNEADRPNGVARSAAGLHRGAGVVIAASSWLGLRVVRLVDHRRSGGRRMIALEQLSSLSIACSNCLQHFKVIGVILAVTLETRPLDHERVTLGLRPQRFQHLDEYSIMGTRKDHVMECSGHRKIRLVKYSSITQVLLCTFDSQETATFVAD
jgi:hypothetical protein